MKREDYQMVKEIFHSALDVAVVERPRFLDEKCSGNPVLRREVERLLDSYDSGYLEEPALERMAQAVANDRLKIGQEIGHYKIIKKIGAGGMGEVYLAEDIHLKRKIALKILPAALSLDKERLRRFEQEACAASALNHPNILTVHEFGTDGETIFIASEFVNGETLRERLGGKPIGLSKALDIASQVAAALNVAHESGIIHRDIKPENIMLRADGLVKVLDFGLAKLIESKSGTVNSEDKTVTQFDTMPGMVMGTPSYMSPEQARGKQVDARSDVWSLGVVLYEMLAGHTPFAGETPSDKIASVLTSDPAPFDENIPRDLNQIVGKALQKNRDDRYQTTKDLLITLKNLRRILNTETAEWSSGYRISDGSDPVTITENSLIESTILNHPESVPNRVHQTTGHRTGIARKLALTVMIMVLTAAGFGLYKLIVSSRQDSEAFQNMRLTKLTFTGNVTGTEVSISPDGKYIVYVVEEGNLRSLWVKHIATSSNMQIVPPAEVEFGGIAFSQDGNYVYYSSIAKNSLSALYQVPVLGGNSRMLIEYADGAITFSRDGRRIAFGRGKELMIANADGSAEQHLVTASEEDIWSVLAWSPDETTIISTEYSLTENNTQLIEVDVKTGTKKAITSPPWLSVSGLAWLPDGSALLVSGRDTETKLSQLWLITYPEGKTRKVSNDLNTYAGVSIAADGKSLVSIQNEMLSNIWIVPDTPTASARQITFEKGKDEGLSGIAWTSDGRIVYTVRITGTVDLWIVNEDGSDNRQLTFNAQSNYFPSVSPDNQYIVFVSTRSGNANIWRMDLDGGNLKQLTDHQGSAGMSSITPDGKWIIYQLTTEKTNLWKVSIDGGVPVQVADMPAGRPTISPDGEYVACASGEGTPDSPMKLAIVPFSGGQPPKLFDLMPVIRSRNFRWSSDGKSLIYVDNRDGIYNLWSQSLDGGAPRQLTDFKSDQIFKFDLSNSGKGFALARGHDNSDVILIDNFRE